MLLLLVLVLGVSSWCSLAEAVVGKEYRNGGRVIAPGSFIAPVYTLFSADGSLNLDVVDQQAAKLSASGVDGVFVGGTTGEGVKMSLEERMSLAKQWAQSAAAHNLKFILHVGAESVAEAVQLSLYAKQLKADAVAAMPPTFYKPSSPANLVEFFAPVAAAAGTLPFYYYHIDSKTGVFLNYPDVVDFQLLAGSKIPNYVGLKYTSYDMNQYSMLLRQTDADGKSFHIMYGRDEQMSLALYMGGDTFVCSTFNYAASLYHTVVERFQAQDAAGVLKAQVDSQNMVNTFLAYNGGNTLSDKAVYQLRYPDLAVGAPRLPSIPMQANDITSMNTTLASIGFYNWV
jgi:N-acetylneuraminate lyase